MSIFAMPLQRWLYAHRMCRDFFTSGLILAALAPWVLLNRLNDAACEGCSLHMLLIYRDGGHFGREKLDFDTDHLRATKSFGTRFFKSEKTWRSEQSQRSGEEDLEGGQGPPTSSGQGPPTSSRRSRRGGPNATAELATPRQQTVATT